MKHDDFCLLMFYWNYFNRKTPLKNFHIAYNCYKETTPHVKVVEVANKGCFQLNMPGVIRLTSDQCLWQKERVVNHVAQNLTDEYKYIAYVDSDLIFTDPDWIDKTKRLLQQPNSVVQPFSKVHYLPKGHTRYHGISLATTQSLSKQVSELGGNDSYTAAFITTVLKHSAPGGVWAMRLEDIRKHPIYDLSIIGGGDTFQSYMFLGISFGRAKVINKHLLQELNALEATYSRWMGYRQVLGIDQDVMHINHGSMFNRQYSSRYTVLSHLNVIDELKESEGLYKYVGNNVKFKSEIELFFKDRQEDD